MNPNDFPVPKGSFIDVLGIDLVEVAPGSARAVMKVEPQHLNQAGTVQAGCLMGFADAVAGWATKAAVLESGASFSTLELNANVMRAARQGDLLEAVASTVHQGRSTAVVTVKVSSVRDANRQGRPVASFRCTQMIIAAPARPASYPGQAGQE